MFDRRSEKKEFFGFSREEGIASACAYFGKEAASLQIVDLPESEISGLAGRKGILAWEIRGEGERSAGAHERHEEGDAPRRNDSRGSRESDERRDRKKDRDRRDRNRDRSGRGERDERSAPRDDESTRGVEASEESAGGDYAPKIESAKEAKPAPRPASENGGDEELSDSGEFVAGLIEYMKLGTFDINEREDGKLLIVQLSGPAIEKLIANGGGRVIDSIQFLSNQADLRREGEGRKIVIEAAGNEDKQREYLEKLALRAAKKAEETGKSIALDPMNSRDRRMVHMVLKDAKDLATMSVGEGNYRRVVVVPKGAPEYEEALKSD